MQRQGQKWHLAETMQLAELYSLFVMSCLTVGRSYRVAVFAPKEECSPVHALTVRGSLSSINSSGGDWQVLSSCSDNDVFGEMLAININSSCDVIIGPGTASLCQTVGSLEWDIPVVSWSCHSDPSSGLIGLLPTASDAAKAIAAMLTHFQWTNIGVITSTDWTASFAKSVSLDLATHGFSIRNVVYFDGTLSSVHSAFDPKNSISHCKVLLVFLSDYDAEVFFTNASNHINGSQAFILVRAHTSIDPFFSLVQEGQQNASFVDSVLVFQMHANSWISRNTSDNVSDVDETLFNAIQLVSEAVQYLPSPSFAQNITFNSLHGALQTDNRANIENPFFSLWDYSAECDCFDVVAEFGQGNLVFVSSVQWPKQMKPPSDMVTSFNQTCSGFNILYSVAILATAAFIVGSVLLVVFLVRRQFQMKQLARGPNKLLLGPEDLTFVHQKTNSMKLSRSLKSNAMLDKPDLLKNSEPSLSNNSFSDASDNADVARYNGDLVYVKDLHIKGFEMKSKVRMSLRQLREMRHENINPLIGCFQDPALSRQSLIWEYASRRSLEDIIHNEVIKLDWDFKLSLMTDLVRGMRYIHASSIKQHGNLKSGNCVIDSRWVLKVTDYGITGLRERFMSPKESKPNELLWTAPELLRDEVLRAKGTQKGDVYSFAIIMQEIIVRGHPFCMLDLNAEEILRKVKKPPPLCRPSVSPGAAPPQYIQLMKQSWAEMPDMRPDFESLHHQFKELTRGKKTNIVDTMFKMLEKYSNDLEEIVRQRTVALEEEKKKTENLLTQMLPKSVAESLLLGKPVEPTTFEEVTIYFSDIVGFTTISAMSTPLQVVKLLNDLYTMFDSTIDDYDVYKVETIGDAYMVVSGLPTKNGNRHAGEIGTMALDLLSQCGQFTIYHMPDVPLRLRIGLHTGSCVAGVVGLRMPRYCLFGDTVNTASRMESTGAPFRIHISEKTKNVLDQLEKYIISFRGEVELKGKGVFKTFWLTGKDGFEKPLPEPPAEQGDNHGLQIGKKDPDEKKDEKDEDNKSEEKPEHETQPKPEARPEPEPETTTEHKPESQEITELQPSHPPSSPVTNTAQDSKPNDPCTDTPVTQKPTSDNRDIKTNTEKRVPSLPSVG